MGSSKGAGSAPASRLGYWLGLHYPGIAQLNRCCSGAQHMLLDASRCW